MAEKFGDNEEFYTNLLSELGTDSALEKQMYRVRAEAVGPTPKDKTLFHPENFLEGVHAQFLTQTI